jgi:bifunctional non-homologous end joining protein LigD
VNIIYLSQHLSKRFCIRRAIPARESISRRPFVIHQYADIFDGKVYFCLRLELEGRFRNWVIPDGPSLHPHENRPAIPIDDTPLACADFEGILPPDEYGGGAVLVWDSGQWEPEGEPASSLKDGKLAFNLTGRKLQGKWTLVCREPFSSDRSWHLTKQWDRVAAANTGDILARRPESVLTGRLIDQLIAETR